MTELNHSDVSSEEVQEIMGYIPRWIVRRGISVILLVLLSILIGSYFFKYPEIIQSQITLTTKIPPVSLEAKSGGIIEKLYVNETDSIFKDDVIAIIENRANLDDIKILSNEISFNSNNTNWSQNVLNKKLVESLFLGEIQDYYTDFIKSWNQYRYYLIQGFIPKKRELLNKQIQKQEEYLLKLNEQNQLMVKELAFYNNSLIRDSLLYAKEVISLAEFENKQSQFLSKKSANKNFEASLKNIETSILNQRENSIELQLQYENEIAQFELNLTEKFQTLKGAYNQWERSFLIKSPIDGIITFTKYWSEKQLLKSGDIIATIIPFNGTDIIGKLAIPLNGFGKVNIGQKVNIKLLGFPYMEFGILTGEILSISQVPITTGDKTFYIAEVSLDSGMNTSYKENLRFIQEMKGTAEIITKDKRLIERFFSPLKALFKEHI